MPHDASNNLIIAHVQQTLIDMTVSNLAKSVATLKRFAKYSHVGDHIHVPIGEMHRFRHKLDEVGYNALLQGSALDDTPADWRNYDAWTRTWSNFNDGDWCSELSIIEAVEKDLGEGEMIFEIKEHIITLQGFRTLASASGGYQRRSPDRELQDLNNLK